MTLAKPPVYKGQMDTKTSCEYDFGILTFQKRFVSVFFAQKIKLNWKSENLEKTIYALEYNVLSVFYHRH